MKLMQYIKTKHLHEKDRCKDCARFFCHDAQDIKSTSHICILNCNVEFYLYQAFDIFVMLEMKLFQNDEYNANDMRLDKIITFTSECCLYLT